MDFFYSYFVHNENDCENNKASEGFVEKRGVEMGEVDEIFWTVGEVDGDAPKVIAGRAEEFLVEVIAPAAEGET